MRLSLLLPPVQPDHYPALETGPSPSCSGPHFQQWQSVPKPPRDTQIRDVVAMRYRCVRCGRTFRVFPTGVSRDQTSARLKGVAVLRAGHERPGGGHGAGSVGLAAEQGRGV